MAFADNPVVYLLRKMWQYSKGNRRSVILLFALFFLVNIIDFATPFVAAAVLNTIQDSGVSAATIRHLVLLVLLFPLLTLASWAMHGPARVIERKNSFLVRAHYKKYLLDGTMALPAAWHADHQSGETIDRINKGSDALYEFSGTVFEIIAAVMMLATSIAALAYFDPIAGLIAVVAMLLTFRLVLFFDARLSGQYAKLFGAENIISAKIFDAISNISTVIILRLEKLVSKDIFAKIIKPLKLYRRNIELNEWKWFWVSVCGAVMKCLVLVWYLMRMLDANKAIMVGTIFLLYTYVQKIEDVFFRFAWTYSQLVEKKTKVENAEMLAADFSELPKPVPPVDEAWRRIRIEKLHFSYHGESREDHLRAIDFDLVRGQKIALIGASGSGKTTLLKVLRGLYAPSRVRLFVDGEVEKNGLRSLSDAISLIPQDPEIFAATIRENITLGLDRTDDDIRKYTDMACFSEVADRLPRKLDSSIFEKGVNLSGGEKQRLALSRGLMASVDKSIVMFDEPTSSIDTKTEHDIYQNIFYAFSDKTVISTIHRLHLLPMFDRIYLFRAGRIAASGTLDELLRDSSDFRSLWKRQASARKSAADIG